MFRKLLLPGLLAITVCFSSTMPVTASLWPNWWFGNSGRTIATQPVTPVSPTPSNTPTATPNPMPAQVAGVTLIASTNKTIRGVVYRIELNAISVDNVSDGYQVSIWQGGRQLTAVDATKTQAKKIFASIQKYKPTSSQMLIARLLVLALF